MNYTDALNALGEAQPKDTQNYKNYEAKKHNATATQIASFRQLNASGKRDVQAQQVLAYLRQNGAQTSRSIATALKMERASVTRTLFDLREDSKAYVAYAAKCPITNRTVEHYAAIQGNLIAGEGGSDD